MLKPNHLIPQPIILLICLSLLGCSPSVETHPVETASVMPSPSQQVSETPSPRPTRTATSTRYPTGSPWPKWPTRTPKPPTVTPVHTAIPPEDPEAYVLELLETNGGCQPPCFWGVTPGETPWNYAYSLLVPFSINFFTLPLLPNEVRSMIYDLTFPVPKDIRFYEQMIVTFSVTGNNINEIIVGLDYTPSEALDSFGSPDEIWLNINEPYPNTATRYVIGLFYPDKGILVGLTGHAGWAELGIDGESRFSVCPHKIVEEGWVTFWLWNPREEVTFKEVATPRIWPEEPTPVNYYLFKDVTEIDNDIFYQTYLDPESTTCFESLLDYWLFDAE